MLLTFVLRLRGHLLRIRPRCLLKSHHTAILYRDSADARLVLSLLTFRFLNPLIKSVSLKYAPLQSLRVSGARRKRFSIIEAGPRKLLEKVEFSLDGLVFVALYILLL